jgi:hypothetical protein
VNRLASILLPLAVLVAGVSGPVAAAAAPPTRATASSGEPDVVPWQTAPCATGAMTAHAVPGRLVEVSGWIMPCPGTPAPGPARYAVVYFGPAAGTPGRALRYTDPADRTTFAGRLNTFRPAALPTAACLAFSPTGLLSCVSIDTGDDPDLLVVTPIPTDHPRVSVPVLGMIRNEFGDPDPYCGTCV